MTVENKELQELYGLIYSLLDGFNRTHDAQVRYVDFSVELPPDYEVAMTYDGTVVLPFYAESIIDRHYRDLISDDFDWFDSDDWVMPDRAREVERILAEHRKIAQRCHREGRDLSTLWFVNHKGDSGNVPRSAPTFDRRRHVRG